MTNAYRLPLNRLALTNVPLWLLETLMVVAWSSGFVGMRFS
jgi:hypothetical protein